VRAAILALRYLRDSIKGPRGPTVGYGPHRSIYLTGTDAKWQGREGFRAQAVHGSELTGPVRPYGSAHFGPGLAMDTNCSD
jgi:hypothetical protein